MAGGLSSFLGGLAGGSLGAAVVEIGIDTRALSTGLAKAKGELQGSSKAMAGTFASAQAASATRPGGSFHL